MRLIASISVVCIFAVCISADCISERCISLVCISVSFFFAVCIQEVGIFGV